jgi:hypothetical protein
MVLASVGGDAVEAVDGGGAGALAGDLDGRGRGSRSGRGKRGWSSLALEAILARWAAEPGVWAGAGAGAGWACGSRRHSG